MSSEMTLHSALASRVLRTASVWSSIGGDIWDQAYHYSRYQDRTANDNLDTPKKNIEELRADIASLGIRFDWRSVPPILHLDELQVPLMILHSVGDSGANYNWSERPAKELSLLRKPYDLCTYPDDEHCFSGEALQHAMARDVEFFERHMN